MSTQPEFLEEDLRVREIVGWDDEENDLPDVSEETLELYYDYLREHLTFPFEGGYSRETGPLEFTDYDLRVTGLLDLDEHDDLEFYGLMCEGRQGRRHVVVPLAEVEVEDEDGPNAQLVSDYRYWFWNYR